MPKRHPQPWFRHNRNSWYVTIDGKQHNLNTPDEKEAYERYHRLMLEHQSREIVPSQDASVRATLAQFLEWSSSHTKRSTYQWYRRYLKGFVESTPKNLSVLKLKPFHLTKWLEQHPRWSDSSKRAAIGTVKRALKWAVEEGYIDKSPLAAVKRPGRTRRQTILTPEQRRLILVEASDDEFRDLLILAQETGARPQELISVESRHVDLENALWVFPVKENKTGARTGMPRVVHLTPTALEITRRSMVKHPSGTILRNSNGEPWTSNAIRCRFRRLRRRLADQLPGNLCMYVLRHSYATDALSNGVDPITVAELMGHVDVKMLSQVYQHVGSKNLHMKAAAIRATQNACGPNQGEDHQVA